MNDSITTMIAKAKAVLDHAYAPYSNFQVASCLRTEDGSFFTGVNVENAVYGLTICAETSAICQMINAGQQKISDLVVMNGQGTICPPCGGCRQRIAEFGNNKTLIHLCSHKDLLKTYTLDELLPHAFKLREGK